MSYSSILEADIASPKPSSNTLPPTNHYATILICSETQKTVKKIVYSALYNNFKLFTPLDEKKKPFDSPPLSKI